MAATIAWDSTMLTAMRDFTPNGYCCVNNVKRHGGSESRARFGPVCNVRTDRSEVLSKFC